MSEVDKGSRSGDVTRDRMFRASEVIPNATSAFLSLSVEISTAKEDADVVLDTSALLLPYSAGSESLKEITSLFGKLVERNRLFIPAQASREFVTNRPFKLADLQKGLQDKMSRFVAPSISSYPILEDMPEYQSLMSALTSAKEATDNLQKASNALVSTIRNWEWNDPVSAAYREVITPSVIVECSSAEEDIYKEVRRRYELGIPPGYKDGGKEDGGIGDFLIWKTILQLGGENKRHLIFVSGDEKPDWQYSSNKTTFLPRVELLIEYSSRSDGKMFYMIPLSRLLELFEGESESVTELQKAEENQTLSKVTADADRQINELTFTSSDALLDFVDVSCPYCSIGIRTQIASRPGSSATPVCASCQKRFHVNRTRDDILVRPVGQPSRPVGSPAEIVEQDEEVQCPNCKYWAIFPFSKKGGTAGWVACHACPATFPVRRMKNGDVVVTGPPSMS